MIGLPPFIISAALLIGGRDADRLAASSFHRMRRRQLRAPKPRRLPIRLVPGWLLGGAPSKGRNRLNRKRLTAWRAWAREQEQ